MHNNKQEKGLIEVLLLVSGVVAIVFVGIFYLMTTKKSQDSTTPSAQITGSSEYTGETSVITAAQLESEFQAITLDDIDQDFTNIDADLNSL